MSNILDKTFTVRQVWRWIRRAVYVAIPIYIVAVFLHAWNMKIGGVGLNNSPLKDRVPEVCVRYVRRTLGTPPDRTLMDELLLRERLIRGSIQLLVNGPDLMPTCFGYAVLVGLHGQTAGDANFTEQWLDASGDPVLTVRVEYNKPYTGQ